MIEPIADKPVALRHIKSFVIRAGRMTAGQQRALQELWPRYGIDFKPQGLNLDALFGRSAPRILEIGFGSGEALFTFAQQHSAIDCLGIEVHPPGVGHLLLQVHDAGLSNVRVLCHDAVDVCKQALEARSLDAVHIFFPDPWHKKRHHKRRLIQTPFLDELARVLKRDAMLRLATDWQHYAEQMLALLTAHSAFRNTSPTNDFVPRNPERPLTRFERRGQRLGHGVWDLAFKRV